MAIWFLPQYADWDAATRSTFSREFAVLLSMNHPNFPRYLASGTEAGCTYYVREWVEGNDLAQVLAKCRSRGASVLPFGYVLRYFRQFCCALQCLHDRGVVHRALMPTNLLVTADRTIKLLDVGMVKLCAPGARGTGLWPATAEAGSYLAPEQGGSFRAGDCRADVYAVGLITYELLTGILPGVVPERPSVFNPTVPAWFDDVVMAMVRQEAAARPPAFRLLVELPNPSPEAASCLTQAAGHFGRAEYAQAIAGFSEVLRLMPGYAQAHHNRGIAYYRKGNLDGALADLTDAIRLDPTLVQSYRDRGLANFDIGRFRQAVNDLDEALRLEPRHLWTQQLRRRAALKAGRRVRAFVWAVVGVAILAVVSLCSGIFPNPWYVSLLFGGLAAGGTRAFERSSNDLVLLRVLGGAVCGAVSATMGFWPAGLLLGVALGAIGGALAGYYGIGIPVPVADA